MVTTDANLLVVIGQADNHVIGVVTISDVLNYIITPPVSRLLTAVVFFFQFPLL